MIRLMEVLLHAGLTIGGWSAKQIHQTVLTAYDLKAEHYTLNQLRYDLRKLKAHGLLQRDGKRYAYRLSDKGLKVALLVFSFSQASLRSARFQPVRSPARSKSSHRQQTRNCLS